MTLFSIDKDKCNGDGLCVYECPLGIIQLVNSIPEPTPNAEGLCIKCGHCVAVCPNGALSHKLMKADECAPVQKNLFPSPEMLSHFFKCRRSIRNYKDKLVSKEVIEQMIDMANWAPTGHNLQPVKWLVIYDKKQIKEYVGLTVDWMKKMIDEKSPMANFLHFDMIVSAWEKGMDTICREAPHLIIAYGAKSDPTAQTSCTIALSYLELSAFSLGIGACWAGLMHIALLFWPPLRKAIGLSDKYEFYGAMMIGYPKFKYHLIPLRNNPSIEWK
ncbi:MAG: nitroreductase family protein [Desulfobacterales bacterium]|nr:nitroreductase family protein [Desulfobacterales bacterium]